MSLTSSLTLAAWRLRRNRTALSLVLAGLFLFELLIVWIADSFEAYERFATLGELLPDVVRNMAGFDAALLLSLKGAIAVGYLHPVAVTLLIITAYGVGSGPLSDIAERRAELYCCRPLGGADLVAASFIELSVVSLAPLSMLLGTRTALWLLGRSADLALTVSVQLAANDAGLVFAFGGVFLLLSALSRRPRSYTQAAFAFALGSYLLEYVARLVAALEPLAPLSLFHHVEPLRLLTTSGSLAPNLAALAAVGAGSAMIALVIFSRRDLV